MLPLWIIDITEKSGRRDRFQQYLGQISHIHLPDGLDQTHGGSSAPVETVAVNADVTLNLEAPLPDDKTLTAKEKLEIESQLLAEKNARIEGNYWFYTNVSSFADCTPMPAEADEANKDESVSEKNECRANNTIANDFYNFQSRLVNEGIQFIDTLRHSNVKPYQTINILVIGDITEEFSRQVFPSVAIMLQKEKGRILPYHIHQGMEIIGMLYIPCDVNSKTVKERVKIQRTLTEIDVQHTISSIRGYDHLLPFQNVQERTSCSYKMLDQNGLAAYMLQCVINLYYACDINHPVISGTGSADKFYLSMGGASTYFDLEIEDEQSVVQILRNVTNSFKEKGNQEKTNPKLKLIDDSEYTPKDFIITLYPIIQLSDLELEEPPVHPVRNFAAKYLKRFYYEYYLRFYPAKLMRKMVASIEKTTKIFLEDIALQCKRKLIDAQRNFLPRLTVEIGRLSADDGGLPAITQMLHSAQEVFSNHRRTIQENLEEQFWQSIIKRDFVPEKQHDDFLSYHDTYSADLKSKNGGAGCEKMKADAVGKLKQHLSAESTVLSRICRSLLLGIVCALAIVPVLELISPWLVNLGNVRQYAWLWSAGLFIIPALIELIASWSYHKRKKRLVSVVKAYYLHDAYARIANRIDSEINNFYDKMIELCDAYQRRCDRIRQEVTILPTDSSNAGLTLPTTMFNQPLNGGSFNGSTLIPENEIDDLEIRINYSRCKKNSLDKHDYFLLINQFKKDFEILFRDVELTENFKKEFDNDTGLEKLLTKSQQEERLERLWNENKELFLKELKHSIRGVIVPREDSTIGEKISHYALSQIRYNLLEPLFQIAAPNGELSSSADCEYADVKVNTPLNSDLTQGFLPITNTKFQVEPYDLLYKKHLFVTIWRSFETISLNRILPREDFDQDIRVQLVHDAELNAKERSKQTDRSLAETAADGTSEYVSYPSSLLLWAISPEDTSTEWFKLFPTHFSEAFSERNEYRKILNKND